VVTAWIDLFGEPVGQGTVSGGAYALTVPQYGGQSFAGRTLTFKLGGLDASETGVWKQGGGDELTLTATG
jgi:hypothetical protein